MAGLIHDYPILIDVTTRTLIKEFKASVAATLPDVIQGDKLRLLISCVRTNPLAASNPSQPWEYVSPSSTLKAGIGDPTAAPELGTFWIAFGSATSGVLVVGKRYQIATFVAGDVFTNVGAASNATGVVFTATGTTPTTWTHASTLKEITTDLVYNASATAVQTALNAMASIAAAGNVTVTADADGGPYRCVFGNVGDQNPMSGDGSSLYPTSTIEIFTDRAGTAGLQEIQTIAIQVDPAALCTSFSAFPVAAIVLTSLQTGAAGVPAIWRVKLDPNPYGGSFTLTYSGQTTAAIAYDATADEVQLALEALSNIAGDGVTASGVDISVSGASPQWDISFLSSGALSGPQAITADATGLLVPTGMIGLLDLNTEGILHALGGDDSVDLTFEVEDSDIPCTILHEDITVINDLIPDNPGAPRGVPTYLTSDEVKQQYIPGVPCSALTGGAAGALDALATASFLSTGTLRICVVAGEFSMWQLQAGTTAESAANGIVRPDDYNGATNAVIWTKVL